MPDDLTEQEKELLIKVLHKDCINTFISQEELNCLVSLIRKYHSLLALTLQYLKDR